MTRLTIMADYFQIYLCDPAHMEDWADLWNDQTVDDRVIAADHVIVFTTGRNMIVPVDVSILNAEPDLTALVAGADHAVMGSLRCESGELKIAGCTDYLPDAFGARVANGLYGAAFLSFGLGAIEPQDRLDGDDHYALHIWPTQKRLSTAVLKRWQGD